MGTPHSNLSGQKFNRLTVIEYVGQSKWLCLCDCGNKVSVVTSHLKNGHTRSCGCYQTDVQTKHGASFDKTYRVWISMRSRCRNPNDRAYPNYGGRGIKVCERWEDYSTFLSDMGLPPDERMQIDRTDNNGNYEPGNCKWVYQLDNLNNRRNNVRIEYNGRTQTIAQWAAELGIHYRTLNNRINRGWSVERAFTEPVERKET